MTWDRVIAPGLPDIPALSHAAVAGDTIYVSGMLATDGEKPELIEGGIKEQTAQALRNLATALLACGAGLEDVVKVNVYLTDMSMWQEMNEAYLPIMGPDTPPRITIGCSALALGALVEIDCIAHRPRGGPDLPV